MQSFEDVLREFEDFLQMASYLEVLLHGVFHRSEEHTSESSHANESRMPSSA